MRLLILNPDTVRGKYVFFRTKSRRTRGHAKIVAAEPNHDSTGCRMQLEWWAEQGKRLEWFDESEFSHFHIVQHKPRGHIHA